MLDLDFSLGLKEVCLDFEWKFQMCNYDKKIYMIFTYTFVYVADIVYSQKRSCSGGEFFLPEYNICFKPRHGTVFICKPNNVIHGSHENLWSIQMAVALFQKQRTFTSIRNEALTWWMATCGNSNPILLLFAMLSKQLSFQVCIFPIQYCELFVCN